MKYMEVFCLLLLFSGPTWSQEINISTPSSNRSSGIFGYLSFGSVHFDLKMAPQSFTIQQGQFFSIGGEKDLGILNLSLNFDLNYLKSNGQTSYNYTGGGGNYTSSSLVNFYADIFQAAMGLKFKFFDRSWLHPYIEAGGLFGYYGIKYQNLVYGTNINGPDTNFKNEDSTFDFGAFEEVGIEFVFADSFGVAAAARMTQNKTQPFTTMKDEELKYNSQIYFVSLLKKF